MSRGVVAEWLREEQFVTWWWFGLVVLGNALVSSDLPR